MYGKPKTADGAAWGIINHKGKSYIVTLEPCEGEPKDATEPSA